MTLVGLLPPLCDNGHLLVDGGYSASRVFLPCHVELTCLHAVDNLPVSIISRFY